MDTKTHLLKKVEKKQIFLAYYSLICFASGYFLSYLLRNINAVIAPDLIEKFDLDKNDLGLLTSAYLIGFALAQVPLGIALDKFGPQKSQAVLLIFAALGCVIFSSSESFFWLFLARGFIGSGVGGCLMAGFKQLSLSFTPEKLPKVYGLYLIFGATGAIFAGRPLGIILEHYSWQEVFFFLALCFVILIFILLFLTPKYHEKPAPTHIKSDLKAIWTIAKSTDFIAIAPLFCISVGSQISFAGIWLADYSRGAKFFSDIQAEYLLSLISVAQVIGYLIPSIVSKYSRKYTSLANTTALLLLPTPFLLMIVLFNNDFTVNSAAWFVYAIFSSTGFLFYAHLTEIFPKNVSGKVNTTLNLTLFIVSFFLQWGFGFILKLLTNLFASDDSVVLAYDLTMFFNIILIMLGLVFYCFIMIRKNISTNDDQPIINKNNK